MSRFKLSRVMWGLVLIIFLSLVALEFKRADIEADLHTRSQEALHRAGINWAWVTLSGRDVLLHGAEDQTPEEKRRALAAVDSVYGVSKVKDASSEIKRVDSYVWSASRSKQSLKLTKYVPSDADRKTIIGVANASLPGLDIDDRMKVALGVTNRNSWLGAVSFAMQQLRFIENGHVVLTETGLQIHGRSHDSESYVAFLKNIRDNKPDDVKITAFRILPPKAKSYNWSIALIEGKITLDGYIPDTETREDIIRHLGETYRNIPVMDNLLFASGEPDGWKEMMRVVIRQFCKLQKGIITLTDDSITISGIVESEEHMEHIAGNLRTSLPAGFVLNNNIKIRKKESTEKQGPERQAMFQSNAKK